MVNWENGIGAFVTYGFRINGPGVDETGKKMCHKMSAWEPAGPLLLLCRMPYKTVW